MPEPIMPLYPIYVPSKGRGHLNNVSTMSILERDNVPYNLVVEPQEEDIYRERFPKANVLVLPFRDRGSVVPARNWIKEHATASGAERHWQLDDNIVTFYYRYKGQRLHCRAGIALRACEDLTDRYENVAISGLQYGMFAAENKPYPPFTVNQHVYSCSLILNSLPHWWRGMRNEDTDICLQVLSDGWCTLLLNAFLADKLGTLKREGGNTTTLGYWETDGRLKMARELERRWPGVVEVKRRFGRAQHVVAFNWRKFDTPLIRKENPRPPADYNIELKAIQDVQSPELKRLLEESKSDGGKP